MTAGGDEVAEAGVGDEAAVAQRAAGERVVAAAILAQALGGVLFVFSSAYCVVACAQQGGTGPKVWESESGLC